MLILGDISFFFLITLLILLFLSYLIESFVTKKSIIKIYLKHPNIISNDLYPTESILRTIEIETISVIGYHTKFGEYNGTDSDFYKMYLDPIFYSKKKINGFLEINKKKYDFNISINENDVKFERSPKIEFGYDLILPNNPNNEKFFLDYLIFLQKTQLKNLKSMFFKQRIKNLKD